MRKYRPQYGVSSYATKRRKIEGGPLSQFKASTKNKTRKQ